MQSFWHDWVFSLARFSVVAQAKEYGSLLMNQIIIFARELRLGSSAKIVQAKCIFFSYLLTLHTVVNNNLIKHDELQFPSLQGKVENPSA